ncbi:unnamed protein product [Fraxinus pennsylvanica]|uniref:Uncharacterized protein n=1 Tax=Fraxinus pennsylvanica TaxID=56036 RepID=A0AAD2E8Y0_9LAMI|nr:unnamed protein product [Fraxinus pennsylvanica]
MEQKINKEGGSIGGVPIHSQVRKIRQEMENQSPGASAAGDQTGGSRNPPAEAMQIAARVNTATDICRQLMEQDGSNDGGRGKDMPVPKRKVQRAVWEKFKLRRRVPDGGLSRWPLRGLHPPLFMHHRLFKMIRESEIELNKN